MSGSGRGKLLEDLLKNENSNNSSSCPTEPTNTTLSDKEIDKKEETLSTSTSNGTINLSLGRGILWNNVDQSLAKLTLSTADETSSDVRDSAHYFGSKGRTVELSSNYIHIKTDVSKSIHMYEVRFSPYVDSLTLRNKYLTKHCNQLGGVLTFDGIILYLPIKLKNKLTTFVSINDADGSEIEVRILYKSVKPIKDCIHLYNLLFNRVMRTLKYTQLQRKHYHSQGSIKIPQQKLEIWPGYVTTVNEYKGGLLLCCDVSHKLLSQKSVYELLKDFTFNYPNNYKAKFCEAILGSVIITRYNNIMYRVDDVLFEKSPLSTFVSSDGEITYMEYYRRHYNIRIEDHNQPLLLNYRKQRLANCDNITQMPLCLVPELSYLTGLSDSMRSDYRLMRDIAHHTHMTPMQRIEYLEKFCRDIKNCPEASKILQDWGLTLSDSFQTINGRILDKESIIFKNGSRELSDQSSNFTKELMNNEVLNAIYLYDWILLHTTRDMKIARILLENMQRCGSQLGFKIEQPNVICLQSDNPAAYINALKSCIRKSSQIVVCIQPNAREDVYCAIKTFCCTQIPIPSQVINSKTLLNEAKAKPIALKILLQMNCKLGGSLWSLKIPFKNTMICGIDVYHNSKLQHNSVAALVASLNRHYSKWYSKEIIQKKNMELVQSLCSCLISALIAYRKENNIYPDSIIIYRDGIGNGHFHVSKEFELPQLEEACRKLTDGKVKITFIIVQKRTNTRLFPISNINTNNLSNVLPGTIVDKSITRLDMYDFYLVPQEPCQGTANAVHYVVLHDENKFKADIIQRLSYKLCFLYYNWPGSIRVPACCQYAHKLAYLVGSSIKKNVSEDLSLKLYYL